MSRYDLTAEKVDDLVRPGTLRYKLWKIPSISLINATRYTVTRDNLKRIDWISYQMYGDSALWWVLALVNHIRNPLRDLVAGVTLTVPTMSAITASLTLRR